MEAREGEATSFAAQCTKRTVMAAAISTDNSWTWCQIRRIAKLGFFRFSFSQNARRFNVRRIWCFLARAQVAIGLALFALAQAIMNMNNNSMSNGNGGGGGGRKRRRRKKRRRRRAARNVGFFYYRAGEDRGEMKIVSRSLDIRMKVQNHIFP